MATKSNVTVLRNISGVTKFFSFLGPNGAELTNGQDFKVPGDIFNLWQTDTIQTAAYKYALDNSLIAIIRSPEVVFFDPTLTMTKVLKVDNGSVSAIGPDYGSYTGTAPTA